MSNTADRLERALDGVQGVVGYIVAALVLRKPPKKSILIRCVNGLRDAADQLEDLAEGR